MTAGMSDGSMTSRIRSINIRNIEEIFLYIFYYRHCLDNNAAR